MKKLSTGEIISISSILVSILMVALKGETNKLIQIIIISLFCVVLVGYLAYIIIRKMRLNQGISSAAIIAKAKKFTNQLLKLCNKNSKELKKFDYLQKQRKIEKSNYKFIKKLKRKAFASNGATQKQKEQIEKEIKEHIKAKSENYGDIEAIKAYNNVYNLMEETSLVKNYEIAQKLIQRIFEMNRILLQLEQHNTRIKLGKYVAYHTNDFVEEVKAYMDLIGWSYILLGENKKGFSAIFTAINLIEAKIGTDGKIPDKMSEQEYYDLLFLKIRAYRHLGTTYYTYKDINSLEYCNKALELLSPELKKGLNNDSAFENMKCGVYNNLYLAQLYENIKNAKNKGKFRIEELKHTLELIEKDLDEIQQIPEEKKDKHRIIKLLSLKCQVNKALSVSEESEEIDLLETEKDLKFIEDVLNKNIYFDDAMEVYANQKVQLIFEEVKDILLKNN